jgi:hypothetical protein
MGNSLNKRIEKDGSQPLAKALARNGLLNYRDDGGMYHDYELGRHGKELFDLKNG